MAAQLVTTYTPVEMDRRALALKTAVYSQLYAGMSDHDIKDFLKKAFNVDNEEYAQNILDYVKENPDPDDWY